MYSQMTVAEIKLLLERVSWDRRVEVITELKSDKRKGAQRLKHTWQNRYKKRIKAYELWESLRSYEGELARAGREKIAGIDEAGRGPLAGPVVAAAVILPKEALYLGLNDSKLLTETERERLYGEITRTALAWGVGSATAQYIDKHGIVPATRKAMELAITQLKVIPDYLLIDALELTGPGIPQESIVGGDGKCASIAAASVIAKVTRDRWMKEWARLYPGYGFASHKGYLTREHYEAIIDLGPSPLHRCSFSPLADLCHRKFPARGDCDNE
jgi:ribonuclease HII